MKKKLFKFLIKVDSSQAILLLFTEVVLGVFLSVFSFFLFLGIGKNVVEHDWASFDSAISAFIYSLRSPFMTKCMLLISFMGGNLLIYLASSIMVFLFLKKYKRESMLFFFIFVTGALINLFLKILVGRPRPDMSPLMQLSTYSFPSGHSMNSFVFYATIAYFVFRFTKNRHLAVITSALCISLILLIGFSRVYLGVHYPTDVLAGFAGGFWWFVTVIVMEKTLQFYKVFRKR